MSIDRFNVVLNSEHPEAVIGTVLQLSYLRSAFLVGQALAKKYPTEASWDEALSSEQFLEMVEEFAPLIADIRVASEAGPVLTPETVQRAVAQHYNRALEAVKEFADLVEVRGEELLSVLTA